VLLCTALHCYVLLCTALKGIVHCFALLCTALHSFAQLLCTALNCFALLCTDFCCSVLFRSALLRSALLYTASLWILSKVFTQATAVPLPGSHLYIRLTHTYTHTPSHIRIQYTPCSIALLCFCLASVSPVSIDSSTDRSLLTITRQSAGTLRV
jgi:hypothetical protein